ncbi:hypothetical protein PRZ48_000756 [Zasmidium cellare]|uniref:Tudor domain-containing protein n=1 Tax=Zasmidium cellare TaxID=395010 RepID=A0ABR0EZV9_ZASCE|nr:hypothetical protein PRZ48_000756 [Zasmidium cellare]
MSTLAELKAELATSQNDLDFVVNEALVINPTDEDSLQMKANLEESIADLKARIAAMNAAPPPPPSGGDPSPKAAPKFDMSKHPKFRQASPEAPPPPPEDNRANFSTGDSVMAKYSVDHQWYAATIVGKTGSSTDPVYSVKFTGYDDRENKRKHEVRAIESKKRKADGPPPPPVAATAVPPPPPPTAAPKGATISAAPVIDATLVQKREPSKVSDGPTRMAPAPKKLKGNRTLQKSQNNWMDWQKTGPKKPVGDTAKKLMKKESQFRTPDNPNAKVGFTGSGKAMTKDPARMKWNYTREEPEED